MKLLKTSPHRRAPGARGEPARRAPRGPVPAARPTSGQGRVLRRTILACALPLLTASCATDIKAHAQPAALVEKQSAEVYLLRNAVALELVVGSVRSPLPAGSRWKAIGSIAEGNVYRPLDHLLQVHTGHSYEGYLVCSEGRIIGVYLPVEDSFVAVREAVPILLEVKE